MPDASPETDTLYRKPAAFAAAAGARQGARQLCGGQRPAADGGQRPHLRLRRGHGPAHPGQGPAADAHGAVLVRAPGACGAQPPERRRPGQRGGRGRTRAGRRAARCWSSGCKPLPVEAVVRGYLAGSGWAEYQRSGTVCGVPLPAGLVNASRLAEPIFTPATKAEAGAHDENIGFAQMEQIVGAELAARVREVSLRLYREAAALRAAARHHHRRHQVRVRPGRGRHADADGRGADARLVALLAAGRLPRGRQPAQLRQAVPARLARGRARRRPALEQEGAGAGAARAGGARNRRRAMPRRCAS